MGALDGSTDAVGAVLGAAVVDGAAVQLSLETYTTEDPRQKSGNRRSREKKGFFGNFF